MLNSIKAKMMLIISILIVILIGATSFLLFTQSSNILEETIIDNAANEAKQNSNTIIEWLN